MPKLLYIAGSGRSGSTLLDLLLGNHRQISGLGEVHRLSDKPYSRQCSCQEPIMKCAYWRRRIRALCDMQNVPIEEWTNSLYVTRVKNKSLARREWANLTEIASVLGSGVLMRVVRWLSNEAEEQWQATNNSWDLYDVVATMDNSEVVVDSTKNALRMKLLYMTRPQDCYIIHLVRDGRAVVASAQRRKDIPITKAARRWRVANRNVELALMTVPSEQAMQLRYEDLCDNPEDQLRSICDFVGVEYQLDMPKLSKRESHEIPGNPMLFRETETTIVKDERWKSQLTAKEISEFQRVAGRYNLKYGYKQSP